MNQSHNRQQANSSESRFKPVGSHPDFIKMEEKLLEDWYRSGLVEKYLRKNDKAKKRFSFLDGPITANNPMGVHHARGRTYKDLWQRYFTMRGFRQRYQNGFDCQGLWVEVEVEKELKFKSKKDILDYGVEKFVERCKERVLKYAAIQTEQSKRLGMFMDWERSYYTMSDENNYAIWNFLKVCHQQGWIYKGKSVVPWCPRCETAISQHEMLTEDYQEVTHESIYLKMPLEGSFLPQDKDCSSRREYLLVWTTTPWTIPANIAVAVDEKLKYSLVEGASGDFFWLAKETISRVFGKNYKRVVKTVLGRDLLGLNYQGPFDDLPAVKQVAQESPKTFHRVVATDGQIMPISTSEGTGLVHTSVSTGAEDYRLGQKLGLPLIPAISDDGSYLEGFGFLSGQNAKKQPDLVLGYLQELDKKEDQDWVFDISGYRHRYPVCWRCKTELMWKLTDEWYIAMDKPSKLKVKSAPSLKAMAAGDEKLKVNNKTLREQLKEVAKKVNWIPAFGLERELDWLENMQDWLISKKNRFWGLALPIWECTKCDQFEVVGSKEELREKTVKGWSKFNGRSPHKPWIDEVKIKCSSCGGLASRVEPVGNPWLDAGIVPFSTMPGRPEDDMERWFPADFITEAFPGQFKNWFYSLLVMSTVLTKTNPFKTVLGFESVVGEDGRPMHKSWGNAIEFNEGAGKIGVDVMRWIYAKTPPESLLPFGYKKGEEVRRRFLLIMWNSYRFFVSQANADGWQPRLKVKSQKSEVRSQGLNVLDRWILARYSETVEKVTGSLDNYQSAPATEALELVVDDFSTWYLRRSRSRVGVTSPDNEDKKNAYQTMYFVLVQLSKLLAPFVPYVADAIYRNLTGEESVHLAEWPEMDKKLVDQGLIDSMKEVREAASLAHAQRKAAGLPLRQRLLSLASVRPPDEELDSVLKEEVNVKEIKHVSQKSIGNQYWPLDTTLTDELRAEGRARELIRKIQQLRREAGVDLGEEIVVGLPDWPKEHEDLIKSATLAARVERTKRPVIKRINRQES